MDNSPLVNKIRPNKGDSIDNQEKVCDFIDNTKSGSWKISGISY